MAAPAESLAQPLCLGSAGRPVLALQLRLNTERVAPELRLDGRFGKSTQAALAAFQLKRRLKPDGVVGRETAAALGWRYTAGNAPPYVLRYDKPPMPGLTPPLLVIKQVIRDGLETYKGMLIAEINKNGLSEQGRKNAISDIETILWPGLMESLDSFASKARAQGIDPKYQGDLFDFDVNLFRRGLMTFTSLALELGRRMKEVGGNVSGYADVIDRGLQLDQIGAIAGRLLKGDQSAAMTIAQIQMAFRAALGTY
ncbi:MAG: peptidoglycan-binding protein [Novosphingobium sp.]|nr:peptidoglycan-binding protein [Novosphingobium sp.]